HSTLCFPALARRKRSSASNVVRRGSSNSPDRASLQLVRRQRSPSTRSSRGCPQKDANRSWVSTHRGTASKTPKCVLHVSQDGLGRSEIVPMNSSLEADYDKYLATVAEMLDAEGIRDAATILRTGSSRIVETGYDNWNGGTTIYTIYLTLPPTHYARVSRRK